MIVVGLLACCLAACGGPSARPPFDYMPNMRDSVAYDAFAPNPLFANHQTLRPPAAGTIPRGFLPLGFGAGLDEAARAGRELSNPIAPTPEALARGEELYTTFCQVCHGATGAGDGPLVPRIAAPPAYNSPQLRDYPPGRLFHVITFGQGRMPSYASQIRQQDRWRLIHHLRRLQALGEPTP
jgi:mono/diheme cytochrome c family protein